MSFVCFNDMIKWGSTGKVCNLTKIYPLGSELHTFYAGAIDPLMHLSSQSSISQSPSRTVKGLFSFVHTIHTSSPFICIIATAIKIANKLYATNHDNESSSTNRNLCPAELGRRNKYPSRAYGSWTVVLNRNQRETTEHTMAEAFRQAA